MKPNWIFFFFVTNVLFMENMHFKAPWRAEIMKEGFKGLKVQLVWGEEKNVGFEIPKYSRHELGENKGHTLKRPSLGSGFTEYYYLWLLNLNFVSLFFNQNFFSSMLNHFFGWKYLACNYFIIFFKKWNYYNLLLTKLLIIFSISISILTGT